MGIQDTKARRPLSLSEESHDLMRTPNKKVASGVDIADLYTFEASPYELLPFAQVYRRDQLPDLASGLGMDYQRPLMPEKLKEIRTNLLTDRDFMFPNSILIVLSSECRYDESTRRLLIPDNYGSISVIDGQHRLFSYADANVEAVSKKASRIMVTAIHFRASDDALIQQFSACTFVEINTNQTKVAKSHLDAIAYDILGKTDPRSLSAKVILEANERARSSLYGFFDTNRTGLGIVPATTVQSSLAALPNIARIRRLQTASSGAPLAMKKGYELLFEATIEELSEPKCLIHQTVICIERFFNLVKRTFPKDWPRRVGSNESSLKYAKVIAGFVKLLWKDFITEGMSWDEVERELKAIRTNLLALRELDKDYDDIVFNGKDTSVPDSDPRASENYRFLHANRTSPTSIRDIIDT